MATYEDASYIINEIKNIPRYRRFIKRYQEEVNNLEIQKSALSAPKSPNGKESIGEAKGNSVYDYTIKLSEIITQQDRIKKEQEPYIQRLINAEKYRNKLAKTAENEFVTDFFDNKLSRDQIAEKYGYTNSYDRCQRIIVHAIERK